MIMILFNIPLWQPFYNLCLKKEKIPLCNMNLLLYEIPLNSELTELSGKMYIIL
jgi:hypothetical protein